MDPSRRVPRLFLACALATSPLAAWQAAEPPTDDAAAARASVAALRAVGVAIFSWVADQEIPRHEGTDQEEGAPFDWSRCPAISHDDLAKLLGDHDLPATDGWGHPLELCLARDDLGRGRYLMGVRSPGRDGVFSGSTYAPGAFSPDDLDRDVVWMDGFFVTWPQRQE